MDTLINTYNIEKNGVDLELEFRLKNITRNVFIDLLDKMGKDYRITNSVDIINSDKTKHSIRRILYDGTKAISSSYHTKYFIIHAVEVKSYDILNYRVSLTSEKDEGCVNANNSSIVRVKRRYSYDLEVNNIKWRLDMTIVDRLVGSDVLSLLSTVTDKMFKEDILEDTSGKYIYEIELELVDNKKTITEQHINATIDYLMVKINSNYRNELKFQTIIHEIYEHIHGRKLNNKLTLKQLFNQVEALIKISYADIYPLNDFSITNKIDGDRAVCYNSNGNLHILSDRIYTYYIDSLSKEKNGVKINIKDIKSICTKKHIIEGEVLIKDNVIVFYAFDILMFEDKLITYEPFSKRLEYLKKGVENISKYKLSIKMKTFYTFNDFNTDEMKKQFDLCYKPSKEYVNDGIIFTEMKQPYKYTKLYKWKPSETLSIDFLAKKANSNILGVEPYIKKKGYDLYLLFVGISSDLFISFNLQKCYNYNTLFTGLDAIYFPIQFSPSSCPNAYIYYYNGDLDLDGKIVELRYNDTSKTNIVNWELLRVRDDRAINLKSGGYYGNDYRVAELTWISYMDKLEYSDLYMGISNQYFAKKKTDNYFAQTAFISFIKAQQIKKLMFKKWVIDCGIGKGQDLNRYIKANIEHLIGIDIDNAGLMELITRKYSYQKKNKKSKLNLITLCSDLTENFNDTVLKLSNIIPYFPNKVDGIVINLAIHYLMNNLASIRNVISFAYNMLCENGLLLITCMDGKSIFDLLKDIPQNKTWDKIENGVKKFSIKKLYNSDTLLNHGQKIGVLLPFSNNTYYEENLVNIDYLIKMCELSKLTLVEKKQANDYLEYFSFENNDVFNKLTESDQEWTNLFCCLEFKKN